MRYSRRLLLVVLVVGGLLGSALVGPPAERSETRPSPDQLVLPDGETTAVWPYTSRTPSVEGRTLALNVIVHGDPDRVQGVLERRSEVNWTAVEDDEVGESVWGPARGAARYTYVTDDPNSTGQWVTSTYQLGTGAYLGERVHLRAYPAPSGNWTAFQAHTEYWDWFRLRHTVTGVAPGARFVERDLRDEPFVESISREYHGLRGGGSDGWITVVEFVPAAAVLAGAAVPLSDRRRELVTDAVLSVSIAALVLGVRAAGIAAESLLPGVDPKLFAAVLYPMLVLGPPALVTALARDSPSTRAALLAAGGLGAGLVLDMGSVGANTVPVQLALHRVALVSALGLFANGVAREDGRTVGAGAVAWLVTLGLPLFGVV